MKRNNKKNHSTYLKTIAISLQIISNLLAIDLKIKPKFTGKQKIQPSNHHTINLDSLFSIEGPIWSVEMKRRTKGGKILNTEAISVTGRISPIMSKRDLRFSKEALADNRKMVDWKLEREYFAAVFEKIEKNQKINQVENKTTIFEFFRNEKLIGTHGFEVNGTCDRISMTDGSKSGDEEGIKHLEAISLCRRNNGKIIENFLVMFMVKEDEIKIGEVKDVPHNFQPDLRSLRYDDDKILLFLHNYQDLEIIALQINMDDMTENKVLDTHIMKKSKKNFFF